MSSRTRRYTRDRIYRRGQARGTSETLKAIRTRILNGTLSTRRYVVKEDERLDKIAARFLKDPRLWWAIAAASGVGWNLQVPPGTILRIPRLEDIQGITG